MWKLLYRGPSLSTLRRMAADGHIDESAPVRGHAERLIEAPPAAVWKVLTNLSAWPDLVPSVSKVEHEGPVAPGHRFSWTNGGMTIRSRMERVIPNRELSWTGTSYGVRAIHRNTLTEVGQGTMLRSEESMAAPLLTLIFPSHKLVEGLEAFVSAIARAAEEGAASVN